MTIKTRVQGHHLDIVYILVFVIALSETNHSKVKKKQEHWNSMLRRRWSGWEGWRERISWKEEEGKI